MMTEEVMVNGKHPGSHTGSSDRGDRVIRYAGDINVRGVSPGRSSKYMLMPENDYVVSEFEFYLSQTVLSFKVVYKVLFHEFGKLICRAGAINFVCGDDLVDGLSALDKNGGDLNILNSEFLLEFVKVQEP
jgi:hypothetical protein